MIRFLLFGAAWIVIAGGDWKGWGLALAIVACVTWVSLRLSPPADRRVGLGPLLRFGPFFLLLSLRGGWDVALRALRPVPALDPDVVSFDLRIEPGPQRLFLAALLGLFPGTLATRLEGDRIEIHILDRSMPIEAQFRELEQRIVALFPASRA